MKRFVSVWFPHWPMERLKRAVPDAVPVDAPFALVEAGARGVRITAVNAAAAMSGVRTSQPLADARAMLPGLQSRPAEPMADRSALEALARWCGRYGPNRHVCGRDGLWIEITGVAHLFGGEEGLLQDLHRRTERLGLTVRSAIADTHGAAFALARSLEVSFGQDFRATGKTREAAAAEAPPRHFTIAAVSCARSALVDLPVSLLRISPEACVVLRRLGLFRIGQIYGLPRAGLARRFRDAPGHGAKSRLRRSEASGLASDVLRRLDEALGFSHEPLAGLCEPPLLRCSQAFADPLLTSEGLMAEAGRLLDRMMLDLQDKGLGARRLRLSIFRSDGTSAEIEVGTSAPCRETSHMLRLLTERLSSVDAGFGIDALAIEVVLADPMGEEQVAFSAAAGGASQVALARLVDTLSNRLGAAAVMQLEPVQSHIPEAAQRCVPYRLTSSGRLCCAGQKAASRPACADVSSRAERPVRDGWPMPAYARVPRPPLLLPRPERIRVLAQIPEGAPRRFTWRRVVHDVLDAEGPERIAPEWWRKLFQPGATAMAKDVSSTRTVLQDCETGAVDVGAEDQVSKAAVHDDDVLLRPRDYYRVAVKGGAAFWVFRAGLFAGQGLSLWGEHALKNNGDVDASGRGSGSGDGRSLCDAGAPVWFLHGLYG